MAFFNVSNVSHFNLWRNRVNRTLRFSKNRFIEDVVPSIMSLIIWTKLFSKATLTVVVSLCCLRNTGGATFFASCCVVLIAFVAFLKSTSSPITITVPRIFPAAFVFSIKCRKCLILSWERKLLIPSLILITITRGFFPFPNPVSNSNVA